MTILRPEGAIMSHGAGASPLWRRAALSCAVAAAFLCLLVAPAAGAASRIAFSKGGDIWTVRADGSGARRLTSGSARDASPSWSPGRGTVAFLRRTGDLGGDRVAVWLMRSDGSNQRPVTYSGDSLVTGSSAIAFSPSGRQLAGGCSLGDNWYGITVLDLATRSTRLLGRVRCEGGVISLTWSPDGGELVATVEYGGGGGMFRFDAVSGGQLQEYDGYMYETASWQPGGNRLLCQVWRGDLQGAPHWTMLFRRDGARLRTLGKSQGHPVYSPDGRRYAFVGLTLGAPSGLFVADADGSHVRKLVAGATVGDPAWR